MKHRKLLLALVPLLCLGATACKEPGDPPNPESVPGEPAPGAEPGMTTGEAEEVIDRSDLGETDQPQRPDTTVGGPPAY